MQVSNSGDAPRRTLQVTEGNGIGQGKRLSKCMVSENVQPQIVLFAEPCRESHTAELSFSEKRGPGGHLLH